MSTTGRPASAAAGALAERLQDAGFMHAVAHGDGDSLAAVGLLGRALDALDVPFQVSVVRSRATARSRVESVRDEDVALAVGVDATSLDADAESLDADGPLSVAAFDVVRTLDEESADPVLALAGGLAADWTPQGDVLDAADVSRRPGVGIPVADLADGLAHSTLVHASFSGDEGMAGALLADLSLPAELDDAAHRRLASRVALDATEDAPERSADALGRVLRPHVADGRTATVEGYADVLDTVAREAPGLAAAFALGRVDTAAVLDEWRDASTRAHAAVRAADPARYSGFVAVDAGDADPWLVARLVRDYVSPEPAVLAVGEDASALAVTDADARAVLEHASDPDGVAGTEQVASTTRVDDALVDDVGGEL